MGELTLRIPTWDMRMEVKDYLREHVEVGELHLNGCAGLKVGFPFDEWFARQQREREMTEPQNGRMPATEFFAYRISDGRLIGMLHMRHMILDKMRLIGGHIGYGVRPSERRKGYATEMLRLGLEQCAARGLVDVLITCDKGNPASARVILKNGGALENETEVDGEWIQRYWIHIAGEGKV